MPATGKRLEQIDRKERFWLWLRWTEKIPLFVWIWLFLMFCTALGYAVHHIPWSQVLDFLDSQQARLLYWLLHSTTGAVLRYMGEGALIVAGVAALILASAVAKHL